MKVKITNTKLNDSFIVDEKTVSDVVIIAWAEIKRRGWKKDDCYSETLSN
jgi:hypothetical protein